MPFFVNRLASLELTGRTCQEAIPKGKYILKPSIFRCNFLVSGKVVRAACSLYIVRLSFVKSEDYGGLVLFNLSTLEDDFSQMTDVEEATLDL